MELISRRRYERYRFSAPVELSWLVPEGRVCSRKCITTDISSYGMQVQLDAAIALNTMVRVPIVGKDNSASANVRRSGKVDAWFKAGD